MTPTPEDLMRTVELFEQVTARLDRATTFCRVLEGEGGLSGGIVAMSELQFLRLMNLLRDSVDSEDTPGVGPCPYIKKAIDLLGRCAMKYGDTK